MMQSDFYFRLFQCVFICCCLSIKAPAYMSINAWTTKHRIGCLSCLVFQVLTARQSVQNVEENECRRAHDMAVQKYSLVFNKDVTHDEVRCQCFIPIKWLFCGSSSSAGWLHQGRHV